ncbi:MAG: disulfide bond formation protein DsbA [Enterovirga sp.]|nr:disulfide bond formation protein DsbA [Enterovirga sp.]
MERVADGPDVQATLGRQMRLAASLGLVATPSYVIGGAAVLGYPGPGTLARIVENARECGTISC